MENTKLVLLQFSFPLLFNFVSVFLVLCSIRSWQCAHLVH